MSFPDFWGEGETEGGLADWSFTLATEILPGVDRPPLRSLFQHCGLRLFR
jgi:hypothetical protein